MDAYFRILPVLDKESGYYVGDGDDVETPYWHLQFGCRADGSGTWVDTALFDEYEAAQPGDYYYVAFYRTNNQPFMSYSYDKNVLDFRFEVR